MPSRLRVLQRQDPSQSTCEVLSPPECRRSRICFLQGTCWLQDFHTEPSSSRITGTSPWGFIARKSESSSPPKLPTCVPVFVLKADFVEGPQNLMNVERRVGRIISLCPRFTLYFSFYLVRSKELRKERIRLQECLGWPSIPAPFLQPRRLLPLPICLPP